MWLPQTKPAVAIAHVKVTGSSEIQQVAASTVGTSATGKMTALTHLMSITAQQGRAVLRGSGAVQPKRAFLANSSVMETRIVQIIPRRSLLVLSV